MRRTPWSHKAHWFEICSYTEFIIMYEHTSILFFSFNMFIWLSILHTCINNHNVRLVYVETECLARQHTCTNEWRVVNLAFSVHHTKSEQNLNNWQGESPCDLLEYVWHIDADVVINAICLAHPESLHVYRSYWIFYLPIVWKWGPTTFYFLPASRIEPRLAVWVEICLNTLT